MGGRQEARWGPKWCSIFASMALLGLVGTTRGGNTETGPASEPSGGNINNNNCNNHATGSKDSTKRNFLIVSTMDGKVSALNLEKEGNLEWAVDVGAMPLLSSSIGDLVMTKNGVPTRLIPSLDGSLFQFDAENEIIEALPFTADTLLSSSFKLNYDSTIVGGKESATFGVEVRSGKIRYICNSEGCTKYEAEAMVDTEDVLVLTRHTKTVRAVEMRTGLEKWNFSVGQHEVSLVSTKEDVVRHLTAGDSRLEGDDDSTVLSCPPDDGEVEDDDWFEYLRASMFAEEEPALNDIDLKVIVPNGLVIALSKADPGRKLWDYKFDTAIANAWLLEDTELSEVSLFNDKVVPALVDEEVADRMRPGIIPEPLVYIGTHEKQYYVQPSVRLREEVHDTMVKASANSVVPSMPRIRWQPYIATAPSRTPVVTSHSPLKIGYDAENESRDEHGLAIRQDEYPYDMGWYLMSDTSPIQMAPLVSTNRTSFYSNISLSLFNWKEVIAVSLLMSVLVHLVMVKFFPRRYHAVDVSSSSTTTQSASEKVTMPEEVPLSPAIVTNGVDHAVTALPLPPEYISRFATEFEMKTCLGRGGFGVVFEGLNRMDDCAYAIKRITLNNSVRAREKVMREVKALAKLEHTGIVRYYQAWFENPPAGWQEKRDTVILDMSSTTPTHTDAQTHSVFPSTNLRSEPKLNGSKTPKEEEKSKKHSVFGGGDADNPLKMTGGLDRWGNSNISLTDSNSPTEGKKGKTIKGSEGFIPRLNGGILDESGSYSFGMSNQQNFIEDSVSFDIEFKNSESGSKAGSKVNRSESSDMPFQKYHDRQLSVGTSDLNDSFNIVFEDSGCALKGLNEEPSAENSLNNDTQDTRCTNVEIGLTHSHSPTRHSDPPRSSRPGTLPLKPGAQGDGAGAIVDTDNYVDPRAPKLYLYIQMQLCRQDSLKDWLNCNTLRRDRRELLDIFDQIVCAVDYIHDNGLMHRDLKPSNIFFSLDGTVKVGDFGLVTTQEEEQLTPATHTPQHTAHTGQVGTRLYMSPEQVAGHSYNQKVDIFSLGLIFFELFYPFATQMERINTLLAARRGTLPPRFARELPDECVFVKSLLDANPERRPSTKEIQQNPLLRDFEVARQTISRVRPRTRTTSSSGSGNSLSSSH